MAYLIKKMPLCVKVDVTMFVQVDLYGKARHFLFFVFQESRPYFSRNGFFLFRSNFLDFFIADRMKIVRNLKKTKQTEYKTIFYIKQMQKMLSVRKKPNRSKSQL